MDSLENFMISFEPIIACLIPIIVAIVLPTYIWIAVNKIFPSSFKDYSLDIPKKPEKSFSLSSIKLGSFQLNSPFLKLNFYSDFMAIESFGKYIIVSYSEEIIIKEYILFYFFYFKKDNQEYRISTNSKKAIEYLKMKIGKV